MTPSTVFQGSPEFGRHGSDSRMVLESCPRRVGSSSSRPSDYGGMSSNDKGVAALLYSAGNCSRGRGG